MRALLGMVLFSMVGCDALWASYIGDGDLGVDGGATCAAVAGCDLASSDLASSDLADPDGPTPPDMTIPDCTNDGMCKAPTPFCDLNTNTCVASPPPTTAFLDLQEQSIALGGQYMLMTTGDFNGDGVGDVAVSGVFPSAGSSVNSIMAIAAPVEIYLGNGTGGLAKDESNCPIPAMEKPVQLLTLPGAKKDILVATYSGLVYRCSRSATAWGQTPVNVGTALPDGFKQLMPITNAPSSADLAVRVYQSLFPFATGNNGNGSLEVRRNNGTFSFAGLKITVSTSNVAGILPHKFSSDTFETLATTWDALGGHAGIEFHTISTGNMENNLGSGNTASGNIAGTKFAELNNSPYSTVFPFRIGNQTGLLLSFSQNPNLLSVFTGNAYNALTLAGQKNLTGIANGLMVGYAGDANSDNQDEVGFYTLALNATQITRHLSLYMYKSAQIGNLVYDTTSGSENFRGMALEPLKGSKDPVRKDLIALVEDPVKKTSRLIVRRANLNYVNNATNF